MEIDMQLIPTTRFDKKLFHHSGEYLYYYDGESHKFVARFKHKGPFTKAKFIKELIANHTVEDYFMALVHNRKAPLAILRDKNEDWYYGILEAFAGHPVGREAA
jgi:hypothetical protein